MEYVGISNQNEYYTNHYFSTVFEENQKSCISQWRENAKSTETKTPWAALRDIAKDYYVIHNRFVTSRFDMQTLINIKDLADQYLLALGYKEATIPGTLTIVDGIQVPVYREIKKSNGAPLLWVILATSSDKEESVLEKRCFDGTKIEGSDISSTSSVPDEYLSELTNEELATKILFAQEEPPRFLLIIGMNQIALIDRNKWNEKRYLQFELEDIFSRREEQTLQAMAVLLHKENLCPDDGKALLDTFDEESQRNASGVSQDLKYALRESIELLGNEVIYDMKNRQGINLTENPVNPGELTIQCLRYMYRMLFVLFIESRQELGYAPMKSQIYFSAYSLESLRDIADTIRGDIDNVGEGYYLHDTLAKLYDLIYTGYPDDEKLKALQEEASIHDVFVIPSLKAHIFDPEYTKLITHAKIRNSVMLKIVDLMSLTRGNGGRNSRRGRISYANLGINQMGAVYEALLSYRGFIADTDLYEVKRKGDTFNELDVGYFVSESQLSQYDEDERVRENDRDPTSKLRMYKKGTFIYRLAGREREKSASYYTPECLTKCLVKYALKELLKDKTADDILNLTVCEPAMGSAAFLNEAINQLAEAYLDKKQKELGESIPAEKRLGELQKVKMYLADRNVYGIDLNPIAVELAEVSLWLNTIYEGGFVPWFGTQLINGNSLIGARRQCYSVKQLRATEEGLRWYENAPERVPLGTERKKDQRSNTYTEQIYHFLLGDPGMCDYNDSVIKKLEKNNIDKIKRWRKDFVKEYKGEDISTLKRLSSIIDSLWNKQIRLRKNLEELTRDVINIYGHKDTAKDSHTSIRQKDAILSKMYKTEEMQNAGPYARLKFAMDYWCSLWFWPIEDADLLPTRSEFLFDMALILEGNVTNIEGSQPSLFEEYKTDAEKMAEKLDDVYKEYGTVDIPALCKENPRLALSKKIAEEQHFMHWELEFADVFADKDGFDLIIGNPPWVLLGFNEEDVLSDSIPLFIIKDLKEKQKEQLKIDALRNNLIKNSFFNEYQNINGEQNFIKCISNYPSLSKMKPNLYKCFLPLSSYIIAISGVYSFVHPDGVFDDPNGGILRQDLYKSLRFHFQFENEHNLFTGTNDHGRMRFSLNVYKNDIQNISFIAIFNLFEPSTIEECFDNRNINKPIPGIKDSNNNWEIEGHPSRCINIQDKQLRVFSHLFDDSEEYSSARLPHPHTKELIEVLEILSNNKETLASYEKEVSSSQMWNEKAAVDSKIITKLMNYPATIEEGIIGSAHISNLNPYYKSMYPEYHSNNDYYLVDLENIPDSYLQRCQFAINGKIEEYNKKIPETKWNTKYTNHYRLAIRKMLNQNGERTLIGAIIPPRLSHTNSILGLAFKNTEKLLIFTALINSLPFDFYIKTLGKSNFYEESAWSMPFINTRLSRLLINRVLLLNCVSGFYSNLWNDYIGIINDSWSKIDNRLDNKYFKGLEKPWNKQSPILDSFTRRWVSVEIDVLVAMSLGMNLNQLKSIYRVQFPILQEHERTTWYDSKGRIVCVSSSERYLKRFTINNEEFMNKYQNNNDNKPIQIEVIDNTTPDGERKLPIKFFPPFDKCDREKDYETAWAFFEKKYGKVGE